MQVDADNPVKAHGTLRSDRIRLKENMAADRLKIPQNGRGRHYPAVVHRSGNERLVKFLILRVVLTLILRLVLRLVLRVLVVKLHPFVRVPFAGFLRAHDGRHRDEQQQRQQQPAAAKAAPIPFVPTKRSPVLSPSLL